MNATDKRPPDPDDLDEWARDTLGIAAGLSTVETRYAILSTISLSGFAPSRADRAAIEVLTSSAPAAWRLSPAAFCEAREPLIREQVENFAAEFFSLSPIRRRECWVELTHVAKPWPALHMWLARLEPGMDLELPAAREPHTTVEVFAHFLGRLFVERPGTACEQIWVELNAVAEGQREFEGISWKFHDRYPRLAELFSPWIAEYSMRTNGVSRLPIKLNLEERRFDPVGGGQTQQRFDVTGEGFIYYIVAISVAIFIIVTIASALPSPSAQWKSVPSHVTRVPHPMPYEGKSTAEIKAAIFKRAREEAKRFPDRPPPKYPAEYAYARLLGIEFTEQELQELRALYAKPKAEGIPNQIPPLHHERKSVTPPER